MIRNRFLGFFVSKSHFTPTTSQLSTTQFSVQGQQSTKLPTHISNFFIYSELVKILQRKTRIDAKIPQQNDRLIRILHRNKATHQPLQIYPQSANMPPAFKLPAFYSAFFLFIEPISALVGAFYAHFRPLEYLQLTHIASAPSYASTIPLSTSIVLDQLANLYLLFAINEALVLRSTSDLRVWKTVLFGLLLADFGHLYSVRGLGTEIYWNALKWNAIDWGNVGFVCVGATTRLCFLAGVGLGTKKGREAAARKSK
jgi:hypothetical protein